MQVHICSAAGAAALRELLEAIIQQGLSEPLFMYVCAALRTATG